MFHPDGTTNTHIISALVLLVHVAGFAHALHAIMVVRTAQGAIAWAISLIEWPYLAIPLYWVLGRRKFMGYVKARRAGRLKLNAVADDLCRGLGGYQASPDLPARDAFRAMEQLARLPFTGGNDAELLPDGTEAFAKMIETIGRAQRYVLVQFFIVRDDRIGREFKEALLARARAGVKIYYLMDIIGSHQLSHAYDTELRAAGARVHRFGEYSRRTGRWQINFRNHRKIVCVDGREAFIGGLNVGDEYLGRSKRFGPWRDTHLRVTGPAVQCIQLSFLEDWYWVDGSVPELNWTPETSPANFSVLVLPTGPAEDFETCSLFFVSAINQAKHRLWITSPYFVPDSSVVHALQLAALRGVDVRILLPLKPDHLLVYLSSFSYVEEMAAANVKLYRYKPGFMHQKVLLIDDDIAAVGTANLDNRSFRLNFELTVLIASRVFAGRVGAMLEQDFKHARRVKADDYTRRTLAFRIAVRAARLLAPVQ